jgi:hypothetical protein
MATTFIDYQNNKGFYIAETFMQLAWHYVLQEIIKPQYSFANKEDLVEDFQQDIDGIHAGYLVLSWDDYLESPSEEQTMIQVLQNVKTTLQNKGAFISVEEQNTISTEDNTFSYILGVKPFPTAEIIRVIDALIQMLQGTWESTNYNMDLNWRVM